MPRPLGDAGFNVSALRFAELVCTAFLRGVAVSKHLLQIGSEAGIRHGNASIGEAELGFPALKQALQVLGAENGLLASCEVNMKIQPTIAALLERKAGFEADNVLGDMLKALAFLDAPLVFEAWQLGGVKFHDGIFTAQHGLAFLVFESAADKFGKSGSLGGWILHAGLRVMKRNHPLKVAERALNRKFNARGLGCGSDGLCSWSRRLGGSRTLWSRGDHFECCGDRVGTDETSLAGFPARAEIFDIHRILDFQPCQKIPPAFADTSLQQGRFVSGVANASRIANRFRLFVDPPSTE